MRRSRFSIIMRSSAVAATLSLVLTAVIPLQAFAAPRRDGGDEPGLQPGHRSRLTPDEWREVDANRRQRLRDLGFASTAPRQKKDRDELVEVKPLSHKEMLLIAGRGPYRNSYFDGQLPWQRSLRDVSLASGNLFKSFTDVQVSPGRGAGLVLQRTYNSNDSTIGPFGIGWTHAYDIRMEEEPTNNPNDESLNYADKTDYFGGKHKYHRDADGLYTPPPYLYDEMSSDYNKFLINGPISVSDDTDKGMDGTIKHYIANGAERDCDYIQDRYGNQTNLTYGQTVTMGDGSQKNLLTQVTDPSNRTLSFSWTNLGTQQQPAYRITLVTGSQYSVAYAYNSDFNLASVTLDSGDASHLNRTTTFGYTSVAGANGTETGLLSSITDPLNHSVSYSFGLTNSGGQPSPTGTVWVYSITEPGSGGNHVWSIAPGYYQPNLTTACTSSDGLYYYAGFDPLMRYFQGGIGNSAQTWAVAYDTAFNATYNQELSVAYGGQYAWPGGPQVGQHSVHSTFGPHGNVLTTSVDGFSGETTTTTYYNASQYFQKASVTDGNNHTTTFGIGTDTAGNPGDPDTNIGDRGNVLWVQDAGYNDAASPSYHKQFSYAYNQYGQKSSETNLNTVTTQYSYGDQWGNLTQVVQDPGTGNLNRATSMSYDAAGHVLSSTSPANLTSDFAYNALGQPTSAVFPANGGVAGETISYQYDANGRTTSVTDNRGTTSLAYESGNDRVSSVTDPVTGEVSYTYRLSGARLTMSLPGGGTWNYAYSSPMTYNNEMQPKDDPNSVTYALSSVTDDQGRRVDFHSDFTGHLHEVISDQSTGGYGQQAGALETRYLYNYNVNVNNGSTDWGAASVQQIWRTTQWPWMQNSPGTTLSANAYSYDNACQRLSNQITDNNGALRTELYGYDDLNRLVSVDYGDGQTQGYSFDPMGNRLSKTDSGGGINGTENYSFNNANMLLSRGSNNYTNDSAGNTLTGGGRTNTWDAENRLTQCVYNGTTSQFTYSADGIRHRSVVGGTTTDFVTDASMFVREQRGGSNYATYLVGMRGPEYRRDDTAGTVSWYLYDGLGSVLGEVSPSGTVTAFRKYDVYGGVRSGGSGTSAHKFVGSLGHASEDNTGLIYMQARYMDPVCGRFASEDPAQGGSNWYCYASNSPTCRIDADGRISQEIIDAIEETLGIVGMSISLTSRWRLKLGGIGRTIAYIQTLIEQLAGQSVTDMGGSALAAENAEQQNELGDTLLGAADAEESKFLGTQAAYKINAIAELEGLQLLLEMAEDIGFTGT